MKSQFVVTTFLKNGGILGSQLWDSSEPLRIGFPARWILEKTDTGVKVRDLRGMTGTEVSDAKSLQEPIISGHGTFVKISPVRLADQSSLLWETHFIGSEDVSSSEANQKFSRSVIGSLLVFILAFGLSSVISHFQPKEEALIPAQYAKMIMAPPRDSGKDSARDQKSAHKNVGVVRAFKSAEVQHSTAKLLKGGVLSLLAKSDFVSNAKSKSALTALFDKGTKNRMLAPIAGLTDSKSFGVSSIGGAGTGGSGSVGYGKSGKAEVAGQGKSFVSINTVEASVEEGLSKDEVGKVIHSHIAEIRYCYESAMLRNPDVQGKLVVDFTIQGSGGGSGGVKTAKINSSTMSDGSLDQCIVSHLTQWKFPHPKGNIDVAVSYPFIFKTLGK